MSNWQKLFIALFGLLLVSCVALATFGVWWIVNAGGANELAALTAQYPTGLPLFTPSPSQPFLAPESTPGATSGRSPAGATFGVVSSVNGSSITVSGAKGAARTLLIGTGTRVIVVGLASATVGDIQPGDKILVFGLYRATGSLEPRAVIATPANYTRANVVVGMLQANSGGTLSLQTAAGTLAVYVNGDTQIYSQSLQFVGSSDLVIGRYAIVIGEPQSDGTLTAQLILARTGAIGLRQPQRVPPTATAPSTQ